MLKAKEAQHYNNIDIFEVANYSKLLFIDETRIKGNLNCTLTSLLDTKEAKMSRKLS